jgi:SAM-dependent methyltransferase
MTTTSETEIVFSKTRPLFDRRFIHKTADERLGHPKMSQLIFRQAFVENKLRLRKGVNYRKRQNSGARDAYCKMNLAEFEGINLRQQWSNWRTVPANLRRLEIKRPVFAIDLCCGTGHSTEVLACYLPEGSKILGLDFNPSFIQQARESEYVNQNGKPTEVKFNAQSVLEVFCDDRGAEVEAASVDLVNSCGAVGHHFDAETTDRLASQVARVLRVGGVALIDSGLSGTHYFKVTQIFKKYGFKRLHSAKSCLLDRYRQLCLMKIQ